VANWHEFNDLQNDIEHALRRAKNPILRWILGKLVQMCIAAKRDIAEEHNERSGDGY
jgi:hypothetical protein